MAEVEPVPADSIYFWMYRQGLKHVDFDDVFRALQDADKDIRKKDIENYWNGWYRSDLYTGRAKRSLFDIVAPESLPNQDYFHLSYDEYPTHPYLLQPDPQNRYVPCNADGKPLIKWSQGCMTCEDASALIGCCSLAENMKGTKFMVIDCDGDHDPSKLDLDTIDFFWHLKDVTSMLYKPKMVTNYVGYENMKGRSNQPASFHLTFYTDKVIPTMHFPYAHVDIIGNKANSLRYFKNKRPSGVPITPMTSELWELIKTYIKSRRNS